MECLGYVISKLHDNCRHLTWQGRRNCKNNSKPGLGPFGISKNGKQLKVVDSLEDAKAWIAEWEGFGDAFWGYPEPRGRVWT